MVEPLHDDLVHNVRDRSACASIWLSHVGDSGPDDVNFLKREKPIRLIRCGMDIGKLSVPETL